MMNRNHFSLQKALLPAIALILIVSAILFSMKFFILGRMELSDKRNALILATDRMADIDYPADVPEDGSSTYSEIAGNSDFIIRTSVFTLSENERELSVEVTSSSGEEVKLVRRIYLNRSSGNDIEIKSINN